MIAQDIATKTIYKNNIVKNLYEAFLEKFRTIKGY
jgi:hypothetical protein